MVLTNLQSEFTGFWKKYQAKILALILSVYTLPEGFSYFGSTELDGSWVRALNMAVRSNLVFGTEYIFTYGPLGYLSTRNTQYVSDLFLLLADIFLCICFYYVFHKFLQKHKGWFLILFIAIFYYKGSEYTSSLFFFFIIFAIFNIENEFKNYFEVEMCAICGTLAFFIKINYGLVALPIMIAIFIYLLFKNKKTFIIYFATILVVFLVIYLRVNIDIINYVKYAIPMIANYNEAMAIEILPDSSPIIYAGISFVLFTLVILSYLYYAIKQRTLGVSQILSAMLVGIVFYLMFKNGFTRSDEGHNNVFFYDISFFICMVVLLLGFGNSYLAKIICVCTLFFADLNINLPFSNRGKGFLYNAVIHPTTNYFSVIFQKYPDPMVPELKIPDDKLKLIGNSTIDIMPVDVSILQLNGCNYSPRPIAQSYSAYAGVLDSLNANHFYSGKRPEYAMVRIESIDNRYEPWDESITKAMLHLNYDYVDFVSLRNDTALVNTRNCYLLLKAKKGVSKYPKFEKLFERTIDLEDTAHFDFPEGPVYMTVDIDYNMIGKFKSIFYQPPLFSISLFLNHECNIVYERKIVRPIIKDPVLISNVILDNTDFLSFMSGNSNKNAQIKAFAIHAYGRGSKKKVKLTFFKFVNY